MATTKSKTVKKVSKKKSSKPSDNDKKRIVPVLVRLFNAAKGRKRAVNCNWIIRTVKGKLDVVIAPTTVRELIHYIRVKDLVKCLVASQDGYHVTNSTAEYLQYDKTLANRMKEIGAIRRALKRQAATKLGKQKKAKLKPKKK